MNKGGFAAVQWAFGPVQGSRFKVQGSRFSDLKVQSDQRVDDKVRAALNCGGAALNWPKAVEL